MGIFFEKCFKCIKNIFTTKSDENEMKEIKEEKKNIINTSEIFQNNIIQNNPSENIEKYQNKKENIDNFQYFKLNTEIKKELKNLLKENQNKETKFILMQEIQKQNQNIYFKIKTQMEGIKRSQLNYMNERAHFLKDIGYLVRFSNEISNYLIYIMQNFYNEEKNKIQNNEETQRNNFINWIKGSFDENFFNEISQNKNILSQIQIKNDQFLKEIFPNLIKLYFHCYMTDEIVQIKYAQENEKYDMDSMKDDLMSVEEEEEHKVLFTYLPGLFGNGNFFQNAKIHLVTYKNNNKNKFNFKKPIFNDSKMIGSFNETIFNLIDK